MMEKCPIKFFILEQFMEKDMWTEEIVSKVQDNYDMHSDYGRDMANFDVIELVSAGLLYEGESKIDEDGHYKKGHLVTHYSITPLGRSYYQDLVNKVEGKA